MKDKVPNIFTSCLQLFSSCVAALSGRDVALATEAALPVLLDKLGDNNTRIRENAKDLIVNLAGNKVRPRDVRGGAHLGSYLRPHRLATAGAASRHKFVPTPSAVQ